MILGGTHYWIGEWRDVTISIKFIQNMKKMKKKARKYGLGVRVCFHIDWWIFHNVIYFMTASKIIFTRDYKERHDWFLYFFSDSITWCNFRWEWRFCGDSLALWSEHQWKRCKKSQKWNVVDKIKRLRDRVSDHENGIQEADGLCESEERRKSVFLFWSDCICWMGNWYYGFCFGFVNSFGCLIIGWCVYSFLLFWFLFFHTLTKSMSHILFSLSLFSFSLPSILLTKKD